jgi:glyoxylase-like metal-dependent hydrolase (beta-lactamase superfamily II)
MTLNRRTALAAGALGAAAGLIGTAAGPRQAVAQGAAAPSNVSFYRFRVGDATVTAINDGVFTRPLEGFIRNAEIGDVRAAQAEAFQSTERVTISITTLVVQAGGKVILLDAGLGEFAPPTAGRWMANFRAAGFDPAQVDTVVISHFHGDHIGGLRGKDGTATFPRAEVKVPMAEWDFWMDDARAAAAPDGMKAGFANARRVFSPMAKDVTRYEWGREVAPGIAAVAAAGHTPGHTAFAITSGGGRLMVMSDTTNTPTLFVRNPDWSAVFDMDADAARATRHKLLDMAASEKMQVSFYHAPFPATGHIARDGERRYRMVPAMWLPTA